MNLTVMKQLMDALEAISDIREGRAVRAEKIQALEDIVVPMLIAQGVEYHIVKDMAVVYYDNETYQTKARNIQKNPSI